MLSLILSIKVGPPFSVTHVFSESTSKQIKDTKDSNEKKEQKDSYSFFKNRKYNFGKECRFGWLY